jgi:predicted nuclease of predicted toxin-antitoxin system
MKLWLDEHLSPELAVWISQTFGLDAVHVRNLGLARARDREVFDAAREADAVILTKDADFIGLVERLGPPPAVIWLTCGNTSNASLRQLLMGKLKTAIDALQAGESIVEIG